ncbi:MAG TPA: threonine/serine dehydratase [Actinomycetota bacterium]|nr:threonine/serine dehydratase [Actinomycetota bacterium]
MPAPITRDDVERARERIHGHVRRTPVLELEPGALGASGRLSLKLELLQHTGSFKPRGAFNRMLSSEVPDAGVIAASGGNFGLAVAYAARTLGHRAEIFVPDSSPQLKARRIAERGAEVRVVPGFYDEALAASDERAAITGALVLHAFDQPEVVAGQGTVAAELSEQAPDADTVLVAVGGGGLIGGVAAWYQGSVRVVGVEPDRCPTMSEALRAGRPVAVEIGGYAADSLGARRAGEIAVAIATRFVEHVLLVTDDAIRDTQRRLWEELRIVAEPGGAAAAAALASGRYRPEDGERVVALVCGGNTDPSFIASPAEEPAAQIAK